MKNRIKIISLFAFLAFYGVEAQQVVKKDTLKGTELTISMDAKVNDLLTELEENCVRKNTVDETKSAAKIVVPTKKMSKAEICRDNPRILGFKIQVAVVKSNEEANKVKAYFRSKFPSIKAETDASLRPSYKVLVGSYLTKQSSGSDLSRIKSVFPNAISIQYRVFCAEAK